MTQTPKPPASPREFWAEERNLCTVPPNGKTMFLVVHLTEMSALTRANEEILRLTVELSIRREAHIKLSNLMRSSADTALLVENMRIEAELTEALAEVERLRQQKESSLVESEYQCEQKDKAQAELATLRAQLSLAIGHSNCYCAECNKLTKFMHISREALGG